MNRLKISNREMVIREALVKFVCEAHKKRPSTAKHIYESMERYLPRFMEKHMGIYVHTIYDITDIDQLQDIRESILATPSWKQINVKSHGSTFTIGLKYYTMFLQSEYYPFHLDNDAVIEEIAEAFQADYSSKYSEGSIINTHCMGYERNQKARKECINHYGYKCMICGFDFEKKYGELGRNYIEVHHITPLASIKKEYIIDPIIDLVPVCSNCHSIIHRSNPIVKIDEMKSVVSKE